MSGAASTDALSPPAAGEESGQVSVLIAGYVLILLTLLVLVVDATVIQIARVRLYDVADAAAAAAADELSEPALYRHGVGRRLPVTNPGVVAAAQQYLAATPRPANVTWWQVDAGTGTGDGASARVVLTGVIELPIADTLVTAAVGQVTVTVSSTASAVLDRPFGAVGTPVTS